MCNKFLISIVLLILTLGGTQSVHSRSVDSKPYQASGNFYLQYFGGRINPAELPHVYQVFEKLRHVSDKHANRWPELLIIRNLPGYQVLALPDGHIIISHEAIRLIYKDVSQKIGNTRLAFMLGHELAHLAEDDFWDSEMAQSLVGVPQGKQLGNLLGISKNRHNQVRKETKADDKGLLYAALAGYPVGILFEEQNQQDFLSNWVKMTGAAPQDDAHAPPKLRAKLLKQRLQQRMARIEQFHFAVRLAHFGRCDDALQMFADMLTLFPGRALFNNIGYCRLQQSLGSLPQEMANLYWLPQVLDVQSRLAQLLPSHTNITLRGAQLNPLSRSYLDKATKALKAATEMDPFYTPAWLNLASVQFLSGDIYQARASIETARKHAPDNVDIQSLKLLILYEEGLEFDVSVQVIGLMQKLLDKHPEHAMTRFNLARILSQRGRHAKAKQHWDVLANSQQLAPAVRQYLCHQQLRKKACQTTQPAKSYQWTLPIAVGTDILNSSAQVQEQLKQMKQYHYRLAGLVGSNSTIYSNSEYSFLDFDQLIEMVVLKTPELRDLKTLKQKVGMPLWRKQVANGEIWTYDTWAAWITGNEVKEIWVAIDNG